jgi:hypothetical protein
MTAHRVNFQWVLSSSINMFLWVWFNRVTC